MATSHKDFDASIPSWLSIAELDQTWAFSEHLSKERCANFLIGMRENPQDFLRRSRACAFIAHDIIGTNIAVLRAEV
jgi:hypothetical protein